MAKWQDHRCFSNVEHEQHDVAHTDLNGRDCPAGFTCRGVGHSVTHSLYFVVVTATTVGYGDVTPHTPAGMVVAIILICCYAYAHDRKMMYDRQHRESIAKLKQEKADEIASRARVVRVLPPSTEPMGVPVVPRPTFHSTPRPDSPDVELGGVPKTSPVHLPPLRFRNDSTLVPVRHGSPPTASHASRLMDTTIPTSPSQSLRPLSVSPPRSRERTRTRLDFEGEVSRIGANTTVSSTPRFHYTTTPYSARPSSPPRRAADTSAIDPIIAAATSNATLHMAKRNNLPPLSASQPSKRNQSVRSVAHPVARGRAAGPSAVRGTGRPIPRARNMSMSDLFDS